MCDSIRFKNGDEVCSIRQFQKHFLVDANIYGWDGDDRFIDGCMCELDLTRFFRDHPEHKFYHDWDGWWEK